ncbi:hypothetical protein BSL78_25564 [Apostichopus japonicus]|uniref:Aminotransferase class I/classII domain-containing protein n=1 Tax=Stichopus japonicus TaxID=307972 RepID=A0A2G8JPF5_STIJA|nr:hypothetical protein BSL78_25564 [Apostichopus japonicus]
MAPGLRIGWMEGPPVVLAKFACSAYFVSAGDFNHFTSGLLGTALESGAITNHIVETRRQYKGGFFVWIQLPTNMNCDDLMALCLKKYNVTFACGNKFTKNPGRLSNFIRISFSHLEKDTFIEGVKELSDAILELQATNDSQ